MYQDYLEEVKKVPDLTLGQILLLVIVILLGVGLVILMDMFELFPLIFIFAMGILIYSLFAQSSELKAIEDKYREAAPSEWVKKKEDNLYSMNVQDKVKLQGLSGIFLNQISSNDFTDYRYVVKTENGYQLRTLSKQYKGLSEGNIYIQEKPETVSPKIILEQHQYKKKNSIKFLVPEKKE
ncbi:hypothetical protein [Enterococcus sp. AZ101]|uniref:hypothetical protein n=1 Tax=Enterococcus sp. AZ101 TaxID=2774742 RepID=UPI003D2AFE79